MSLTRIILVRHGESVVTVDRVLGGPRSCTGLSPLGRLQAAALRERLELTQAIVPDVLYSSAYPRALETAQIIAPAFKGLEINVEPGFGEHDPGPQCDGMTYVDFIAKQLGRRSKRGVFSRWRDNRAISFTSGYCIRQSCERALREDSRCGVPRRCGGRSDPTTPEDSANGRF